jgi:predicted Zn-dependent protease with MMP-like domain
MDRTEFENIAQEVFDSLPLKLLAKIENVHIVIEDTPSEESLAKSGARSPSQLLGLYEGIPLNKRGHWYGMYPTTPDKVTLYKRNIELQARTDHAVREKIREVLIHEIAHYFGMTEEEVREAGY